MLGHSKLLSYLLILLLAWTPVQPVMAEHGGSEPDGFRACHDALASMGMQHPATQHPDAHQVEVTVEDCSQCQQVNTCDNDCCANMLCASAAAALVGASSGTALLPDQYSEITSSTRLPPFLIHGLYRPPRVS